MAQPKALRCCDEAPPLTNAVRCTRPHHGCHTRKSSILCMYICVCVCVRTCGQRIAVVREKQVQRLVHTKRRRRHTHTREGERERESWAPSEAHIKRGEDRRGKCTSKVEVVGERERDERVGEERGYGSLRSDGKALDVFHAVTDENSFDGLVVRCVKDECVGQLNCL